MTLATVDPRIATAVELARRVLTNPVPARTGYVGNRFIVLVIGRRNDGGCAVAKVVCVDSGCDLVATYTAPEEYCREGVPA